MSQRSDHRAMLRRAAQAGCTIDGTRRHIVILTPNGDRIIASRSPSDINAVRRLERDLRKAGVEV